MIKLLTACLLVVVTTSVKAQEEQFNKHRFYFGVDLLRSVPVFFESGYVLEPSLVYKTPNHIVFNVAAGFADIQSDQIYNNMAYRNEGNYMSISVGRIPFSKRIKYNEFNIMGGLIYSNFKETGTIVFEGDNFGDYKVIKEQSNKLLIGELRGEYWLPVSNRFSVNFNLRYNVLLAEAKEPHFPVYNVPGAGYVRKWGDKDTVPESRRITIGVSVRLIYKLFEL